MLPTLTEALGTNACVQNARKNIGYLDSKKIRFEQKSKHLYFLPPGTPISMQINDKKRWDDKGTVSEQVRHRTYEIQSESKIRNTSKIVSGFSKKMSGPIRS